MPRSVSRLLLLVLVIAGAACGWHLRGAVELAPQLKQLRLQSAPPDPEFDARLQSALKFAGIDVADRTGIFTLTTTLQRPAPRNVALDSSARSAEQEHRLVLDFALRNPSGGVVVGPRTINASRVYAYDPNAVIAKLDEAALIDRELQDILVAQLMRQLSHIEPSALE